MQLTYAHGSTHPTPLFQYSDGITTLFYVLATPQTPGLDKFVCNRGISITSIVSVQALRVEVRFSQNSELILRIGPANGTSQTLAIELVRSKTQ